jgi:hypothetical protein
VRFADVPLVIAMRDSALTNVADNLYIGVVVQTKPAVRCDLIVIENNEIANRLMCWIAVGPYCEVVLRFEPPGVRTSDFIKRFEPQHFKQPSSKSANPASKERAIQKACGIKGLR